MPYTSPNLTYNVTLDVECERATPLIKISQNTIGARIKADFVAGNAAANINTSNTRATVLWWEKPDGEIKKSLGKFITEDNKVYALFGIDFDFTDIVGRCYAYIDLRSQGGEGDDPELTPGFTGVLNTQIFYVDVEGFPEKKNYNGIKIVQISKEHFDDLPSKDPNTLYLVHDGDVVYLYLGDTQVGGSGGYNEVQGDVYIDNVTEG